MLRSLALIAALATSTAAWAEVPTQLQHQGRMFNATGGPLTGPHSLAFAFYDAPSGGAPVWSENLTVEFDNGYFDTALGATNPIDASTVDLDEVYLSIAVDGGPPLSPRARLRAVPYALLSEWAETATNVEGGTVNAGEIQINGTTVIDGSGTIVGSVSWNDLTDIPFDIDDGDSTIADGLLCVADEIIRYDGSNWGCAADDDHTHDAIDITNGVFDINRLPVGGGSTQVAAGDHVHSDLAQASHSHSEYVLTADLPSGGAGALLASYELDETSAPFVDASGGGNDLTQPGAGLAAGSIGHSGDAVNFSGGILEAASGNEIADSPVITTEVWIQPSTTLTGTQTILNKEGAYQVQQIDGIMRFTVTTVEGTCTVDHTTPTTIGAWYHVSAYYNGRLAAVVLNGTEATVACTDGPIAPTAGNPLYLGAEGSSRNEPFRGTVDEVRIWGVAPLQSLVEAAPDPGTDDSSCKAILDAGNSTGDGTYTIDVDGPGPTLPRDVHCDMANGGWTYAAAPAVPFQLEFTGNVQTVKVPNRDTLFHITTYGAASGIKLTGSETPIPRDGSSRGGMAEGRRTFDAGATLYMYVGGQGMSANYVDSGQCKAQLGGWNGGGHGSRAGSGGGGASDVRTVLGDLWSRVLVAGGGGGCGGGGSDCQFVGGPGGGLTGSKGVTSSWGLGGDGGTQTAGGLDGTGSTNGAGGFGRGGDAAQCNDEGGGGGGWYGGGSGGQHNRTGGGGSSYVDGMDSDTNTVGDQRYGHGLIEYYFQ